MRAPVYRIFHTENTRHSEFAPPAGHRLALTQVSIDNREECHCCIRIDVGKRTRFVAYLGPEPRLGTSFHVRLPKPIIGAPNESVTVDVSDRLPVKITIAGYELPADGDAAEDTGV